MAPFGTGRGGIGLDVGTSAVRAAEVRAGRPPVVVRFGQVLLPHGAVRNGEVEDRAAVAQAIATLWKRAGFSSRGVRVGLSNQRVVVRQVEMPVMPRDEVVGAIQFQGQELGIPIDLNDAVMDFEVMEELTGAEGQAVQRLMVVAAQRSMADALLQAVEAARLRPEALELNAYPLVRALAGEAALATEADAIVDIGAGVTNVVVHQGGRIRFVRILELGGDQFTKALADALEVDWDEAEALKHRAGLALAERLGLIEAERRAPEEEIQEEIHEEIPEPAYDVQVVEEGPSLDDDLAFADDIYVAGDEMESFEEAEEEAEPSPEPPAPSPEETAPISEDAVERAADILLPQLDRFVDQVRASLDYYTIQPDEPALGRLLVTGGGSLLGGLINKLGEPLRLEGEPGHSFSRVRIGKVKLDPSQVEAAEPFLSVAVGLALGALED